MGAQPARIRRPRPHKAQAAGRRDHRYGGSGRRAHTAAQGVLGTLREVPDRGRRATRPPRPSRSPDLPDPVNATAPPKGETGDGTGSGSGTCLVPAEARASLTYGLPALGSAG